MTLGQYREIYRINNLQIDELDKVALSVCYYYGLTHEHVNLMEPKKFLKLSKRLLKDFDVKRPLLNRNRFHKDAKGITWGMMVELFTWMTIKDNEVFEEVYVREIHKIAATILKKRKGHREQSLKLLELKANKVLFDVKDFIATYNTLLNKFPFLFERKEGDGTNPDFDHYFVKRFGWLYATKTIAEHEGIELKDAYRLPATQALNDLVYLKAKQDYDKQLMKK